MINRRGFLHGVVVSLAGAAVTGPVLAGLHIGSSAGAAPVEGVKPACDRPGGQGGGAGHGVHFHMSTGVDGATVVREIKRFEAEHGRGWRAS